MKRDRFLFYTALLLTLIGFFLSVFLKNGSDWSFYPESQSALSGFMQYYYGSVKLQLFIFVCGFTVFASLFTALSALYSGALLGSFAITAISQMEAVSFQTVLPYALSMICHILVLFVLLRMIDSAQSFSASLVNTPMNFYHVFSLHTARVYTAEFLVMSGLILIFELCNYIVMQMLF